MNTQEMNTAKFSMKDMWWANTKVAIATFVIAGIYFQFIQVRDTQVSEHETMVARTEYVNERINTKHSAQQKYIEENNAAQNDNMNKIWEVINKIQTENQTTKIE